MKFGRICVLEQDNNRRGDLFGRLLEDVFYTLGYQLLSHNVAKSGREIDFVAEHRFEPRLAYAEFKAHSETIGGGDVNKFIGALDIEKRKIKKSPKNKLKEVVGYFVSLSGFKDSAIEQESDADFRRLIFLGPQGIVNELVNGRILVSIQVAISSANKLRINELRLIEEYDLLAHSKGWVWALYYSDDSGQSKTHVAFIHAEGNPLTRKLANDILLNDSGGAHLFNGLECINLDHLEASQMSRIEEAQRRYFHYLRIELGDIHFEGLPADKESGSIKIQLENIFVPLHLTSKNSHRVNIPTMELGNREEIGEVLEKSTRLAILAKPGGGKSTLIKRIAIAYAYPFRRDKINDKLPNRSWFPIFLRCRELGERVNSSITEIIAGIHDRAEMSGYQGEFSQLVSTCLQDGTALLLIDGLDEIADDQSRLGFVNQLRTFIGTYPSISMIVTSREVGFRVVAGVIENYCDRYNIATLSEEDINALCLKWHKAIIDSTHHTIREAEKTSALILGDRRIRAIAENPLLLTTLLFVKRWAGYLPTKRHVLYQEMIKLLLVTWNVEGHKIIDIDEAEPQLAYVAFYMTSKGQQQIREEELKDVLIDARKQMPEILGYTNISPSEFIKRVELRSSILILTGHSMGENGVLSHVYEFLHLSFQEYLTAKARATRISTF